MAFDTACTSHDYTLSEVEHDYGDGVHILADPVSQLLLARLCLEETRQPEFNDLVRVLYTQLLVAAINHAFPRREQSFRTRMHASCSAAVLGGNYLDPLTQVVCVDIARAGILPSQVCYDLCNTLFNPDGVRQDHLVMSRVVNEDSEVIGAEIAGGKIGGPIDGRWVIFPDPMGATGGSIAHAMDHYLAHHGSRPAAMIALHLIVTPQYIRNIKARQPGARIYALRLDRGMSSEDVLASPLGKRWDEESGLNSTDYIIPGGGGIGELMNNSHV